MAGFPKSNYTFSNHFAPILYFCFLLFNHSSNAAWDFGSASRETRMACTHCCPSLFKSPQGVVSIRDSHFLVHTLSYNMGCLLSTEEVIIVSDIFLSNPTALDVSKRRRDFSDRRVCAYTEHIPFAIISVQKFLSFEIGHLQKFIIPVTSSQFSATPPARIGFLLMPTSDSQMIALVKRIDEELQLLRIDRKLFWPPHIIFIWPEIQFTFRNTFNEKDQQVQNEMNETKGKTNPGHNLLSSWFTDYQPKFTLDSGAYFFFMVQKGNSSRSQANLYMSVWEGYSLKGRFFLKHITSHLEGTRLVTKDEEQCSNYYREEKLVSIEKLNSYFFAERFRRRENFRRSPVVASISVSASETSKWIKLRKHENGSIKLGNGSTVSMYRDLKQMLNFSEEAVVGDRINFNINATGNDEESAATVTGQLNMEAVDISLNQDTITPTRAHASTFLQPTYYGTFHAFFQQPSDNSIRNIVTAPFTKTLWICIFVTWLITVLVINAWGYIIKRNNSSSSDMNFFEETEMWSIAAICQKAWYNSPKGLSLQIIFYLEFLMAFVIYASYSGTIVSFLTVFNVPIKSIDDLIEYKYRVTVHEQSEASVLLAKKLIGNYNLSQNVILVNTQDEISHILIPNGKNAFLTYPDLFYNTAEKQNYSEEFICTNVSSMSLQQVPYKSAMSVKKGSQFREMFSQKLMILMERGLTFRYARDYESSRGYSCNTKSFNEDRRGSFEPVFFEDVLITFLIIIIGCFLAMIIFIVELFVKLRRRYLYLLI